MGNEYDSLEKKLGEKNLSDLEKIKILEQQKELLLKYLIESNKCFFEKLGKKLKEEEKTTDSDSYFIIL